MGTTLKNRTVFITGASRGIGRAIALRAAADGANVVIAAKSDTPHPKLPGTIHTVADEVRAAGGNALAVKLDVRDDASIEAAVAATKAEFGGIDAVVNNAGAIRLQPAADIEMKRFDLIHQINTRAVLAVSKAALPLLKQSDNAHILSLSPPISLDPKWLKPYIPYTVTKYAMTLMSLGMAEEFRKFGIGVNTLWPRTVIATAAVEFEVGAQFMKKSRTPEIMADAAHGVLTSDAARLTGQSLIDEAFLRDQGQSEFDHYANDPDGGDLMLDLYVEE